MATLQNFNDNDDDNDNHHSMFHSLNGAPHSLDDNDIFFKEWKRIMVVIPMSYRSCSDDESSKCSPWMIVMIS